MLPVLALGTVAATLLVGEFTLLSWLGDRERKKQEEEAAETWVRILERGSVYVQGITQLELITQRSNKEKVALDIDKLPGDIHLIKTDVESE